MKHAYAVQNSGIVRDQDAHVRSSNLKCRTSFSETFFHKLLRAIITPLRLAVVRCHLSAGANTHPPMTPFGAALLYNIFVKIAGNVMYTHFTYI